MFEHNITKETAWVEYAACTRYIRHGYRFLVEHTNGRDPSGNLGLYETIIFLTHLKIIEREVD
jgi:hypothetical protein